MLFEAGRVCIKVAGKDAGKHCIILEKIDKNFVLIDGEVTRKRCNISHLEPLQEVLNIKKSSDKQEILDALKKAGFSVKDLPATRKERTKPKSLKRPMKARTKNAKKRQ